MKKSVIIIIAILSVSFLFFADNSDNRNSDETKNFVDDLLSKMTLEEKVGQMTQITLGVVSSRRLEDDTLVMNMEKLREAIVDNNIGSIINTGGAANYLEEWHKIITAIQDVSTKETRFGIPNLYGIDAIHGVNYTRGATLFPQPIALAATRNRDLVRKDAEITAYEMRASGIAWNFNPVLGMGREPLWPRFWETLGEDVYLTCELAEEYVIGMQGDDLSAKDKGAVCIKHYMGYSVPKNGQDRTPAWIPERMLREIFLPPFAAAVEAGAITAMINSGEINGIPSHSDKYILTDILKDELGMEGFSVSDWEDIKRLYDRDRVAETPKEAVKMAVMAGVDMSMVPYDYSFYNYLIELVNENEVPMERIDDAVRRILLVKYKLGLFDNPYPVKELAKGFASEKFSNINLELAREAITLLKNDNSILPLNKNKKVLVTGPTANLLSVLNGGWSITWQGNNESLYPDEKHTILEALQAKFGEKNVDYVEGCSFEEDINIDEALKKAKDADAVIMCLGEPNYCETPGNINNLELYETQLKFAEKMYETGMPVVIVLVEGRPRVINRIVDSAGAIVMAYLPGMEGGKAIADVIIGDYNPSGKLPFSYPKTVNGYTCYDYKPLEHFDVNEYDPQWAFGHGLSYTEFKYSDLKLDKKEYLMEENIIISVNVKNAGEMGGKETVELYVWDLYGSVSRPVRQLKGFEKIYLKPGESKNVEFTLTKGDLSFIGRDNNRITESGDFKVFIKDLEEQFSLK
ncbi:glycoside hydrolase family 3 N-terminal domain-containing protein [Bacteroidota bacterium]